MRRWSPFLVLALLAVGFALLLIGRRPVVYTTFEVPLFASPLQSPDLAVEVRTARGVWAQSVPVKEDVSIQLALDGIALSEGKEPNANLLWLDSFYGTPTPQIEARLEIRDVTVHPAGSIVRSLAPTESAVFFWRLNASRAGLFEGTLWVYAVFTTPDGETNHQLVFARPVALTAVDVLGFPPHLVRSAGWISLALALIAAFSWWQSLLLRSWARVRGEQS